MEVGVQTVPYPEISQYRCYRRYLADYFNFKKSTRSGFSYRQFSRLAGFKSPNYLQLVIQGKRNLECTTALRLGEAMKLKKAELNYFVALVEADNAVAETEKMRAEKNLFAANKKLKAQFVDQHQQQIFSEWYHFAVRELVALPDFKMDFDWMSHKLGGVISAQQAENSIQLLLQAGFLQLIEGQYRMVDPVIDTGVDLFAHHFMQQYHQKLLMAWAKNIEALGSAHEQELGVLTIPIATQHLGELQNKIRQFQDEIIGWAEKLDQPDRLVQLGTYLMAYPKATK